MCCCLQIKCAWPWSCRLASRSSLDTRRPRRQAWWGVCRLHFLLRFWLRFPAVHSVRDQCFCDHLDLLLSVRNLELSLQTVVLLQCCMCLVLRSGVLVCRNAQASLYHLLRTGFWCITVVTVGCMQSWAVICNKSTEDCRYLSWFDAPYFLLLINLICKRTLYIGW